MLILDYISFPFTFILLKINFSQIDSAERKYSIKRLDNGQKLIHDQIREAMQQYREADEMIRTFEDAKGKNKILNKQLESTIKHVISQQFDRMDKKKLNICN